MLRAPKPGVAAAAAGDEPAAADAPDAGPSLLDEEEDEAVAEEREAVWSNLEVCVHGVEAGEEPLLLQLLSRPRVAQRGAVDKRADGLQGEHDVIDTRWLPSFARAGAKPSNKSVDVGGKSAEALLAVDEAKGWRASKKRMRMVVPIVASVPGAEQSATALPAAPLAVDVGNQRNGRGGKHSSRQVTPIVEPESNHPPAVAPAATVLAVQRAPVEEDRVETAPVAVATAAPTVLTSGLRRKRMTRIAPDVE